MEDASPAPSNQVTFIGKIRKFFAIIGERGFISALSYSCTALRNDWRRWSRVYLPMDPRRVLTMLCEKLLTEPFDPRCTHFGNYYLFTESLHKDMIVYSFGVGGDIDFDLALIKAYGCEVHCFDPTPYSITFMEQYKDDPSIHFIPKAVWTEDSQIKFYSNVDGGDVTNASVTNLYHQQTFTMVDCKTIESFMHDLGHKTIDVLKMDIEGAAMPILHHVLDGPVRPAQIVLEIERTRNVFSWIRQVRQLFAKLRAEGYRVIRLPRSHGVYYSIEVLCVRVADTDQVGLRTSK